MRIGAIVLAGGQATRMGGHDKGLVVWRGQTLIEHSLACLSGQVDWLAVSANRHLAQYLAHHPVVFADEPKWRQQGPLAGLASALGLPLPPLDWLLCVPCDMPLLPGDLVASFVAAATAQPQRQAFYAEVGGRAQPSVLFIRPAALAALPRYLTQGGRNIRGFLAEQAAHAVPFADVVAFSNCNGLADLQELEGIVNNRLPE